MQHHKYYRGFRALQNHPCVIIRVDHDYHAGLALDNIDLWLSRHIGIAEENLPDFGSLKGDAAVRQAVRVMSRAVALYGEVVTLAGIPCHKPGRVLNVAPVPEYAGRCRVTIALQLMDNLPFEIFAELFRSSLDLVRTELAVDPQTTGEDRREEILDRIHKDYIETFSGRIPFTLASQSILDMAYRQNVPYRHLGVGIVRLGWGSRSRLLQISRSEADSSVGKELCGNKQLANRALRSAGYPAPENVLVASADEAAAAATSFGWPVVVKPPNRERSEGVTANIDAMPDLLAAYRKAAEYDHRVLVERHVPGDCHRILVANDRIIYVVKRLPIGVTGNGRQSVAELVEAANRERQTLPPWKRDKPWPLDDLADLQLAKQGFSRQSVPDDGQRVILRPIQSSEWGGKAVNLTPVVHPENARLAREVTRFLGLSVSGVDLITTDITRPWQETAGAICEVNFSPEFRWWDREDDSAQVITALVGGDGRIPVYLVTGEGDLLVAARQLKLEIAEDDKRCFLTTADLTEDDGGAAMPMDASTAFGRSVALLMRPTVDALVIAAPTAELLRTGFPVDRFASVTIVDADRQRADNTLRTLQAEVAIRAHHVLDPELTG